MEDKIQEAMNVIQRALLRSYLGRGSAMPEISIATSAGLNIVGNDRASTIWFPGNKKKTRKNPGQVIA